MNSLGARRATSENDAFQIYLAAKKTVDDRALNRLVWERLKQMLADEHADQAASVLEIGTGIGTMIERIMEWELLPAAKITALDSSYTNIAQANRRLRSWANDQGFEIGQETNDRLIFTKTGAHFNIQLNTVDFFAFQSDQIGPLWDLVVAHAFLDLVDLSSAIGHIFSLLKPGGLFYFTLNFDGLSIFEPAIDPLFDSLVLDLYHESMDQRIVKGSPSGDSKTGRHLFETLHSYGGEIAEVGASDWVIYPQKGKYVHAEAYFLHFTITTIEKQLSHSSALDQDIFATWIAKRRAQIEQHELVYIAHQLDFVGRTPA